MKITLKEIHQLIKTADFLLAAAQRGELTEEEVAALHRLLEKIERILDAAGAY